MTVRRSLLAFTLASFAVVFSIADAGAADKPSTGKVVKFARFKVKDRVTFGVVEGDKVREVSGTISANGKRRKRCTRFPT